MPFGPAAQLGVSLFDETPPIEWIPGLSSNELEAIIMAVYRQVLGNAYVMESERLSVAESQFKRGEFSVRDFVRAVAKSDLYRDRFFTNCPRYRAIELNFRHLLGRPPADLEEMRSHSTILDTQGFEAEIDSYLDSDEYNNAFGEYIVPYYRGFKSAPGQTMVAFTNMFSLLKGASSSDKDLVDNRPRVTNDILPYQPIKVSKPRDARDILAEVFKFDRVATPAPVTPTPTAQETEQDALIAKLQQQLADLRPSAGIGASVLNKGTQPRTILSNAAQSPSTDDKAALIQRLQGEIMEARSLAAIGEARLNKWRR